MNWRHLDEPRLVSFRLLVPLLLGTALLCSCSSKDSPTDHDRTAGSGGTAGKAAQGGSGGTAGGGFDCSETADPGEVVSVPGGDFLMGCNEALDDDCSDDEKPSHTLTMSSFEIDATEVTQQQYTSCVMAGACEAPACTWTASPSSWTAT